MEGEKKIPSPAQHLCEKPELMLQGKHCRVSLDNGQLQGTLRVLEAAMKFRGAAKLIPKGSNPSFTRWIHKKIYKNTEKAPGTAAMSSPAP